MISSTIFIFSVKHLTKEFLIIVSLLVRGTVFYQRHCQYMQVVFTTFMFCNCWKELCFIWLSLLDCVIKRVQYRWRDHINDLLNICSKIQLVEIFFFFFWLNFILWINLLSQLHHTLSNHNFQSIFLKEEKKNPTSIACFYSLLISVLCIRQTVVYCKYQPT